MEDNNTQPDTNEMRVPKEYAKSSGVHTGPIIAVLIIVLVLILAGLYLWGSLLKTEAPETSTPPVVNNEPETPRAEADVEILGTLSTSDELDAIDADLSATNLDSLTTDLTTMRSEIDAIYAQ